MFKHISYVFKHIKIIEGRMISVIIKDANGNPVDVSQIKVHPALYKTKEISCKRCGEKFEVLADKPYTVKPVTAKYEEICYNCLTKAEYYEYGLGLYDDMVEDAKNNGLDTIWSERNRLIETYERERSKKRFFDKFLFWRK